MTPEDLMIGYWVLYNPNVFIEDESPKDCYPIKISCGEDIDLAIEDCYSPIPLTPEILEKNGFKECTDGNWTNDNVDFILHRRKDGIFRIQNTNMALPYVSSFQHALKLCGIEKEVEI